MKKTLIVVLISCCAGSLSAELIVNYLNTIYSGWGDVSWNPITALNDGVDGTSKTPPRPEFDFVGDEHNAGAFWGYNDSYVFFRMRLNIDSAPNDKKTFDGAHFLLISTNTTPFAPDYAFAWDSKSDDPTTHGLEMMVFGNSDGTWAGTTMNDLDGQSGQKGVVDINGDSRITDGYLRTVDGQPTENVDFGDTTFLDMAVSWAYLETYTDLERGQVWNIALGALEGSTDHNPINDDIAGGASPSDSLSAGWTSLGAVPEPATISLIGLFGLMMLIGRRLFAK